MDTSLSQRFIGYAAAILFTTACAAEAPNAQVLAGFTKPEAQRYVAQAFEAAGETYRQEAQSLCKPPAVVNATSIGMPDLRHVFVFEPTRVFDNLYYFGSSFVGATVLQTSDGLILIDTLMDDKTVAEILLPGMEQMKLDPRQIKYVVLTHGHGDHYGGIRYLRARFPAFRVVASDNEWAYMSRPSVMPDGSPDPSPKEPRGPQDIGYRDAYDLSSGGIVMHLIETPGHTPGTTSLIYPVRQNARTFNVMQWGGGSFSDPRASLATVEKYVNAARVAKVAVRWGNHPPPNWQSMRLQVPSALIEGEVPLSKYLDVIVACKHAYAQEAG